MDIKFKNLNIHQVQGCLKKLLKNSVIPTIPVQFKPSPAKPFLHTHVYDPIVFVQLALSWQLCVLFVHSLISAIAKTDIVNFGKFPQ